MRLRLRLRRVGWTGIINGDGERGDMKDGRLRLRFADLRVTGAEMAVA